VAPGQGRFRGGLFVKRLVLWTASAALSCSALVVTAGAASSSGPSTPLAAASTVSGTLIPVSVPGRHHRTHGTMQEEATNWSGYAEVSAESNTFTQVTDTFVVPTVVRSVAGTQYVADWVGIGGYDDSTLVQTGIQAVVQTHHGHSNVAYDAWTEMLPKPEKALDLTISPGDTVTATVIETAPDMWTMEVDDVTTGVSKQASDNYVSSGESAEAINERPCIRAPCHTNDLAHLAQTQSPVTFGPGFYSTAPPGQAPVEEALLEPLPDLTLYDIVMTNNRATKSIATPSGPSSAGDGFAVADGASPPLPPAV
jgi:peptidase A4-like protein